MNMPKLQIDAISSKNVGSLLSLAITGGDDDLVESCLDLFSDMSLADSKQLMVDLNRKIFDENAGPLSIQRISGNDHVDRRSAQTFLQAVTADSSTSDVLDTIAKYGGILMQPCFPVETRRTGMALFASANMSLATHFGRELSETVRKAAKVVSESLI
ncbi:hypothetical protein ACFL2H_08125 [Planctomycetota bacterium]